MFAFQIFVLFLVGVSESFESEISASCSDEVNHWQQLYSWWNDEMSIKKPIKCRAPQNWNFQKNEKMVKKILPIFNDRILVRSYPCQQLIDETSIKFLFTGKTEDGVLTGPGRLILSGKGIQDSNEACLRVNRIMVWFFSTELFTDIFLIQLCLFLYIFHKLHIHYIKKLSFLVYILTYV